MGAEQSSNKTSHKITNRNNKVQHKVVCKVRSSIHKVASTLKHTLKMSTIPKHYRFAGTSAVAINDNEFVVHQLDLRTDLVRLVKYNVITKEWKDLQIHLRRDYTPGQLLFHNGEIFSVQRTNDQAFVYVLRIDLATRQPLVFATFSHYSQFHDDPMEWFHVLFIKQEMRFMARNKDHWKATLAIDDTSNNISTSVLSTKGEDGTNQYETDFDGHISYSNSKNSNVFFLPNTRRVVTLSCTTDEFIDTRCLFSMYDLNKQQRKYYEIRSKGTHYYCVCSSAIVTKEEKYLIIVRAWKRLVYTGKAFKTIVYDINTNMVHVLPYLLKQPYKYQARPLVTKTPHNLSINKHILNWYSRQYNVPNELTNIMRDYVQTDMLHVMGGSPTNMKQDNLYVQITEDQIFNLMNDRNATSFKSSFFCTDKPQSCSVVVT